MFVLYFLTIMRADEIFNPSHRRLQRAPDFVTHDSREKVVYKLVDNAQLFVAAKVYKLDEEIDEEEKDLLLIPRDERIEAELQAHRILSNTPLQPYIPNYLYYLYDRRRKLIGLAFSWEDGQILGNSTDKVLSKYDVDVFSQAIQSTIQSGVTPNIEMYSRFNIGFNPRRIPRLWFAEYSLDNQYYVQNRQSYEAFLNQRISELHDLVVNP